MAELATIGDNNPPSNYDLIREEFDLAEAESWLDGQEVENDDQMKAVDDLIKSVKAAEKKAKDQKEAEFRPHKQAADAVTAAWKPALDDIGRIRQGLLAITGAYKTKRAAEQEAIRKAKEAEAERLRREAEAAERDADMKDIEQRREADAISFEAREAERAAQSVEKITGLRTFTVAEIVDGKACINWIAQNDRPALQAFMDDYVQKETRKGVRGIGGVEIRQEKRAV